MVLAVDPTPLSRADVLVSGSGSVLESRQRLDVGEDGTAFFTARDGGRVVTAGAKLGVNPGGAATVLLSGHNTHLLSTAPVEIGYEGRASLTIADGAAFTAPMAALNVNPGSDAAAGNVLVTGPGPSWKMTGGLTFGAGRADVTVADGATFSAQAVNFGLSPTSGPVHVPRFTIDGAGSTASFGFVNGMQRGTITVSGGGALTTTTNNNLVGAYNSLIPTVVRVTGHGSSWVAAGPLTVGNSGSAEVHLEDGAVASLNGLSIGGSTGSRGLVRVSGRGSRLMNTNTSTVQIGGAVGPTGSAELRLLDEGGGGVPRFGPGRQLRATHHRWRRHAHQHGPARKQRPRHARRRLDLRPRRHEPRRIRPCLPRRRDQCVAELHEQ